jgi:hypothetical protein
MKQTLPRATRWTPVESMKLVGERAAASKSTTPTQGMPAMQVATHVSVGTDTKVAVAGLKIIGRLLSLH